MLKSVELEEESTSPYAMTTHLYRYTVDKKAININTFKIFSFTAHFSAMQIKQFMFARYRMVLSFEEFKT